jgi:hypothetical protein
MCLLTLPILPHAAEAESVALLRLQIPHLVTLLLGQVSDFSGSSQLGER